MPSATNRLPRAERERRVLDAAAELFYARGVHEVGMDELIAASGLAKASVYRLYPSKAELISAYLGRSRERILALIDADVARHADDPAAALHAVIDAIESDLGRSGFRGCAFNNASIEFPAPDHPARAQARLYREALHARLCAMAAALAPDGDPRLGSELAVIIDGLYTNTAHLGLGGPATAGLALARRLIEDVRDVR